MNRDCMKIFNDINPKKYYEYGVHFSYVELYTRLVNMQKTFQIDKAINEE